jgi:hypothetical protein
MHLKDTGFVDVDWIHMAQDWVARRVLGNLVIISRFHKMWGIS